MAQLIHYTTCPVCDSTHFQQILTVKDFTVSEETFSIMECATCSLRFTQDVPAKNSISAYYASEDYISHSDTSKGFINKMYKKVRQITLKQKARWVHANSHKKNVKLLEIGSGTGAFASEMQSRGWDVMGLEPDERARQNAMELYQLSLQPVENIYTLPAASFDAIVLWHVLEHVHDLHDYMKMFRELLTPDGVLIIAVPNYTSTDAKIYGEYWAAYDVPRHLYHFSPGAMKKLVEKHGMVIKDYKPMWYDSFYISLLSSRYKNGKTSWVPAIFNGLRSNMDALTQSRNCSSITYIIHK
jgi:2-polyprenyl-3-methyl-5-hydroxy-6-metoxy-1,4-benzoquinol methylase